MIKSGTVFAGRYEIVERIGSGGMADVYKAHDAKLKRDVAIKVLKASLSEDEAFVERFRTEGEAAASLTSANVVSVYDVGNVGSTYYIVMELIDGITLKDYIRRKGMLSSRETMAITAQVAVGLRAAHAHHIVHRDIKPQNIILSRDGKVKVTDFGIARGVTDETRHGQKTELGSVHYIAPEQAKGQPCDERSDIYSLGIVMYEMITGRVPFNKDTQVAVALAHMNETMIPPSEINPDCPVALEQIIFRSTQKSKERRYHNCTELLQDLKVAVNNPSFNFEKQEQETVMKSTTQVFAGRAGSQKNGKNTPAAFQPTLPAVPEADEEEPYEEDEDDTVVAAAGGRQAMTIIDREESGSRESARARRKAGAVIDFTELSPDRGPEEDGGDEEGEERDLFADDAKEDEKSLMDRIILITGIVIGAVIICLMIYIFVTLSGCTHTAPQKPSESGTSQTAAPVESTTESTTEEIIELTTKESEEFNADTDAVVPNVLGMDFMTAEKTLKEAGLLSKIGSQFGYSDEYAAGLVMKQSYPDGTIVDKGSTIVIQLSQGSDKFEILESYIGGALAAFKNDALDYSTNINFEYESSYSDSIPANHIISITPASGLVAPGETVHVVYSLGAEYVVVPNLYGSYRSDASTKLLYSALTIGSISEENSDVVAEGCVLMQSPAAGTTVKNGSSVDLVISLGPKMEVVPDLVGKTAEEAQSLLAEAGFAAEIIEELDPDHEAGTVISQSVEGGDYAPLGTLITLTVAKKKAAMPVLINDTLDNAQAKAEEMGFKIGKTEMETTEDEKLNMIVKSQSVEPGTELSDDTSVDLVIWTYEELPKIPDVTSAHEDEAKASLEEAGYVVAVADEKTDDENLNNIVKSTDPKAGSSLKKGETVTMTVYRYDNGMIKVPDLIGQHWTNDHVKAQLQALGLEPQLVKIPNTEGNGVFTVAYTDPGIGTELPPGSAVTVYIYDEVAPPEPDSEPAPDSSEGE